MGEKTRGDVRWSFWLIAGITLVWNIMGAINYGAQMNSDMLAAYPEAERVIIEGRPAWATGGFAVAVFSGVIGGVLLLWRKSMASYFFLVSLLAVIVTHIHTLGIMRTSIEFGAKELSAILMSLLVAAFLLWYSTWARSKGWID